MKITYHSALKKEEEITNTLDFFENNGSLVFRNDITQKIPTVFHSADVLYSEPAWQKGYDVFLSRANASNSSFEDYLNAINNAIMQLNKPTFLIMGKHMLKKIKPNHNYDLKLYGGNCILGIWNHENINFKTNEEVMEYIAKNYQLAADFSCGYGRLAHHMLKNNKSFICSDINGKCVYYIAKTYLKYGGD